MPLIDTAIQLARLVAGRLRAGAFRFLGAQVGDKVTLGSGIRIDRPSQVSIGLRTTCESGVWFKIETGSARLNVGEFCFLGRGVEIDCVNRIEIGDRTLVAPNVFITDHNHDIRGNGRISEQGCVSAPVHISNDVWIGTGVVILPGVKIGSGSVIGAGAVVRSSIPEFEVWAGVPARRIHSR